jgi:putative transposase
MARPLRIEFAGALCHVTARGNERCSIFFSDHDLSRFLDMTLSRAVKRFGTALKQEKQDGQWETGPRGTRCA